MEFMEYCVQTFVAKTTKLAPNCGSFNKVFVVENWSTLTFERDTMWTNFDPFWLQCEFNQVSMSLSKTKWIKKETSISWIILEGTRVNQNSGSKFKTENFKTKIQLKKGSKDEKMADELYEARKVIEEYRKMLDQYS